MKEGIHPKYLDVEARCACGATWKTRSTKPELHLEICSNCHPFFTGKQKLMDTEGRVERFTKKFGAQTSESRKSGGKSQEGSARRRTVTASHTVVPPRGCRHAGAARLDTGVRPLSRISATNNPAEPPFEAHLSLEPRQPMPDGVLPARVRAVFQTAQREVLRRREIAHAMLVMDRERGGRFARDRRGHAADLEDLPPAGGRLVVRRARRSISASARSASTWIARIEVARRQLPSPSRARSRVRRPDAPRASSPARA